MTGTEPAQLPVAVIGAGPAGLRAVERLVSVGLRPVLIDEAPEPGGQIYRRPPAELAPLRDARQLYGPDAGRASALAAMFEAIRDRVEYRPRTLVWSALRDEAGAIRLCLRGPDGADATLNARAVVLATGAMDRLLPIPGWTLPGVFSLGGAQVMLKAHAHVIGRHPVFAGSGPLLYLVAWQYAKSGVRPAAVIDVASFNDKLKALPGMLARPAVFMRGASMAFALRNKGVPIIEGALAKRIEASPDGLRVHWHGAERHGTIEGDAVAIGHGLKPERQIADLLGCGTRFDAATAQWLSNADGEGRSTVQGVYLAGDMVAINGAHAAEAAGELAASALLSDLGFAPQHVHRRRALRRTMAVQERFRRALEQAFPFPQTAISELADETIVCRCEGVTAGDLRHAISDWAPSDVNRLKAMTRCGMGRCQARLCGGVAAGLMAVERGMSLSDVGVLRAQVPVKPLPPVRKPEDAL